METEKQPGVEQIEYLPCRPQILTAASQLGHLVDNLHRGVDCGIGVAGRGQLALGGSDFCLNRLSLLGELIEDGSNGLVLLVGFRSGEVLRGLITLRLHLQKLGTLSSNLLFQSVVLLIGRGQLANAVF